MRKIVSPTHPKLHFQAKLVFVSLLAQTSVAPFLAPCSECLQGRKHSWKRQKSARQPRPNPIGEKRARPNAPTGRSDGDKVLKSLCRTLRKRLEKVGRNESGFAMGITARIVAQGHRRCAANPGRRGKAYRQKKTHWLSRIDIRTVSHTTLPKAAPKTTMPKAPAPS
jgi:hypothetical protein